MGPGRPPDRFSLATTFRRTGELHAVARNGNLLPLTLETEIVRRELSVSPTPTNGRPPMARAGQLAVLPLTQLDERGPSADLDNRTFTLTFAQPVPIKDLLLLLVRDTNLSIVPDPAIEGSFIGELKNVTVRQALDSALPPLGLAYRDDGAFVRVFRREPETRIFNINYIATERSGTSNVSGGGTGPAAPSSVGVSTVTRTDLFGDLTKGVQTLLSEHATFNLDRKAGLLQVT